MSLVRLLLLWIISLSVFTAQAERILIELQNGSSVSGEFVKRNAEYWIVDLGFDLIKIPERECLKVTRNLSEENQQVSGAGNNLYR